MDERFGSLPNFTKYAEAGEVIARVRSEYPTYEKRLPISLRALYEISQLDAKELEICLKVGDSRDENKDGRTKREGSAEVPLITPTTTAADIRAWRERRFDPNPDETVHLITLAKVKIDLAALKSPDGVLPEETRARLRNLSKDLEKMVQDFNSSALSFELNDGDLTGKQKTKRPRQCRRPTTTGHSAVYQERDESAASRQADHRSP